MSVSTDKDVYIKLSLDGGKGFKVAPRDYLVTMDQSDLEVADLDNLGLWQLAHIDVKISSHCVHLRLS